MKKVRHGREVQPIEVGSLVQMGKLEERPCLGVKVMYLLHSPTEPCVLMEYQRPMGDREPGTQIWTSGKMLWGDDGPGIHQQRSWNITYSLRIVFIYCCINPISNCNVNFMKIQLKSEFIDLSLLLFLPQSLFVRTNLFPLSMLSKNELYKNFFSKNTLLTEEL